jgi:hypothetical protein
MLSRQRQQLLTEKSPRVFVHGQKLLSLLSDPVGFVLVFIAGGHSDARTIGQGLDGLRKRLAPHEFQKFKNITAFLATKTIENLLAFADAKGGRFLPVVWERASAHQIGASPLQFGELTDDVDKIVRLSNSVDEVV